MDARVSRLFTATGPAATNYGPAMTLHWERHGDASAPRRLLLINGLGSPMVAFEQGFVDLLVDRGFVVIRFDNRDVGRSPRHPDGGYALADMVQDTIEVLDAADWSSAHVFGQSMGGMIAQQLAIDAPERVLSLTSLMSSTGNPEFGRSSREARSALLASPPTDEAGWLSNRLETERIWCSPDLWDPAWVESKARAMLDHGIDPAGAARQYRAVAAAGSRDDALAALDVPTLVIHGSADTLISPSGGRHTAEVIPGARYVEVEGMGHDLPPALWPRLADEVDRFIAGVD